MFRINGTVHYCFNIFNLPEDTKLLLLPNCLCFYLFFIFFFWCFCLTSFLFSMFSFIGTCLWYFFTIFVNNNVLITVMLMSTSILGYRWKETHWQTTVSGTPQGIPWQETPQRRRPWHFTNGPPGQKWRHLQKRGRRWCHVQTPCSGSVFMYFTSFTD